MEVRKIDVIPLAGKSRKPSLEVACKLVEYKKRRRQFKTKTDAAQAIGVNVRVIERVEYIFRYGSKLTINNVLTGVITLNYAEIEIQKVLKTIRERQQWRKENESNGIETVQDDMSNTEVTLDYYNARKEYWKQLRIAINSGFKHSSKDAIIMNLQNMLALVQETEEV